MTTSPETSLIALETERRYVARELHDGVAQTVLQLNLQAGICRKLLEIGHIERLGQEIRELEERVRLASGQVRDIIADMRPPKVAPEAELAEYLEQMVEQHHQRGGAPVTLQLSASPPLSAEQSLALTRIVQEALLNIRKHAAANQVWLQLFANSERYLVKIVDDGHGFDPAEVEARSDERGGAGIANMQARAQALGGTLAFTPRSDGRGVSLAVTWPK
jgi:signal transduction histidine kinase